MLRSIYALGTRTELWLRHGCCGDCMLLEHERNYGLGMDAQVTVCSWNTNGMMVWAWMLRSLYALGTRTEFCFGHGCSGQCMLLVRMLALKRTCLQSPKAAHSCFQASTGSRCGYGTALLHAPFKPLIKQYECQVKSTASEFTLVTTLF